MGNVGLEVLHTHIADFAVAEVKSHQIRQALEMFEADIAHLRGIEIKKT